MNSTGNKVALGEIRTAATEMAAEAQLSAAAAAAAALSWLAPPLLRRLIRHSSIYNGSFRDTSSASFNKMFSSLTNKFDLVSDYATPYDTARATYLSDAAALKEATGPNKAARDAYVAATATYTKSLYE